ncbi:MAG: PDZ domain-containing protein [Alphaproteobacteria bacterium]|nr:PDZ domain-containing protein [Alphaproteobacteria bacterium]
MLPLLLPLCLLLAPARAGEQVDAAASLIRDRMGDRVAEEALDAAAIEGMARWLNQETGSQANEVMTRAEAARREASLRGERMGLGIEFTVAAGRGLVVTTVFPGSPAAEADVRAGDIVVAMDGMPFTGLQGPAISQAAEAAARRSQGQGVAVAVDLKRADGALDRLSLTPATFRAAPARMTQDDEHVMVRVDLLGDGVADVVAQALSQAGRRPVVLDLRDVDDGELDAAREVAGLFVRGDGVLFVLDGPAGEAEVRGIGAGRPWRGRLAVLVNHGTAGLAEALAIGLREHAQASLVGTRTAGLSRLASLHDLGGDVVLKLADQGIRGADGTSWEGVGLAPDLIVEAVSLPLVGPARGELTDVQRDAAVRFLAGR